ncbi:MAG TPA: hypothetical protein PKL15_00895 [Saprospiraceae bacterium]|nr:hypothetical protein [Saprospiraceae bacterium]
MNLNTQFVFDGKLKRNLIIGMVIGVVCLAWSLVGDDEYKTRFWTNWLHNSVFFTGIAFMAMFFLSAQITAFAGWNAVIKRVWEAMSQFMWVGLILVGVIVVGVWGHLHHLYHWNDPHVNISDPTAPGFDKVLAGKKGFLNPVFFTVGTLGFLAIWYFWAYKLRQLSIAQDSQENTSFDYYKKQRKWAASFLPLGGFLSTVFLWQLVMSVDPHWYSTMFAWYSMISVWLGSISLTVMLIIYLKSKGYLEYVTRDHLHDVGKFLFGISVFWTYLWFDQFMLIWYANNGEETIYFKERMNHYPVLFWGNLLMNFVAPFLILMRNDTKRKFGTMFFVAAIVFFGHWWDYFYMIKPGARTAAFEATELKEGHKEGNLSSTLKEIGKTTQDAVNGASEAVSAASEATKAAGEVMSALHDNTGEHASEAAPHTDSIAPETGMTETHTEAGHSEHEATAATAEATATHEGDAGHGEAEHAEEGHHGDKSFKLGFTLPGIQEIGVMIGFLSLFLFFFFNQLSKVSLVPLRDPYLEESLHHETGANIDGERQLDGGDDDSGHGHH